jgi:hypothetical protein
MNCRTRPSPTSTPSEPMVYRLLTDLTVAVRFLARQEGSGYPSFSCVMPYCSSFL